ncbi:hypothetical protein FALBO_14954 [Fusarium albosuccineum]|uniref:Uncharacterized protein n=1 Tax=Fusarium albosuccineum TaxID=1237068 RepID=A0A8H4KY91_9HYPO|nr:hypothetical protein FALBO_14954 [Fusarium albosuccineum]
MGFFNQVSPQTPRLRRGASQAARLHSTHATAPAAATVSTTRWEKKDGCAAMPHSAGAPLDPHVAEGLQPLPPGFSLLLGLCAMAFSLVNAKARATLLQRS